MTFQIQPTLKSKFIISNDTAEITEPTKIAVIASGKGGVGKSTLTANLASTLAYQGEEVLVIDGDPRDSLRTITGMKKGVRSGLTDIFTNDARLCDTIKQYHFEVNEKTVDGTYVKSKFAFDLLPSSQKLNSIEGDLSAYGITMEQAVQILRAAVSGESYTTYQDSPGIPAGKRYGWVIMDCEPSSWVQKFGVRFGHNVFVPYPPGVLSDEGYLQVKNEYQLAHGHTRGLVILPNKIKKGRSLATEYTADWEGRHDIAPFIFDRAGVENSTEMGIPLISYERNNDNILQFQYVIDFARGLQWQN